MVLMFEWPADLSNQIMGLKVSDGLEEIVQEWFAHARPVFDNSRQNPFMFPNNDKPVLTLEKRRTVLDALPSILKPFYEAYDDATEFRLHHLTFLSEREIEESKAELPEGIVDICYSYSGLGHVTIYTYDKAQDCIYSFLDGGSNGHDRENNHTDRLRNLHDRANHRAESLSTWFHTEMADRVENHTP